MRLTPVYAQVAPPEGAVVGLDTEEQGGGTTLYNRYTGQRIPDSVVGYVDQWGGRWRQNGASWEHEVDGRVPGENADPFSVWVPGDPTRVVLFNPEPYRYFLDFAGRRLGVVPLIDDLGHADESWVLDPYRLDALFDFEPRFFFGRENLNPYGSTSGRDALRGFAVKIGLRPEDADAAALANAQDHLRVIGQLYDEATSEAIVADNIAHRLAEEKGFPYAGLTAEQRAQFDFLAGNRQTNIKGHREAYEDAGDAATVVSLVLIVVSAYIAGVLNAGAEAAAPAADAAGAGAGAAGAGAGADAGLAFTDFGETTASGTAGVAGAAAPAGADAGVAFTDFGETTSSGPAGGGSLLDSAVEYGQGLVKSAGSSVLVGKLASLLRGDGDKPRAAGAPPPAPADDLGVVITAGLAAALLVFLAVRA